MTPVNTSRLRRFRTVKSGFNSAGCALWVSCGPLPLTRRAEVATTGTGPTNVDDTNNTRDFAIRRRCRAGTRERTGVAFHVVDSAWQQQPTKLLSSNDSGSRERPVLA